MREIHILADIDEISHVVAKKWAQLSEHAINDHGGFHIALSGGSTPRRLYEYLASSDFSDQLNWPKTHIYFGDERSVAPDDEESNFKMATDAMLAHVAIPATQVYRMQAEADDIQQSVVQYSELLNHKLPANKQGLPCFDLVLLGMGDDGHTASLFPGTTILEEKEKPVAAVYVEKLKAWRMSITYPMINSACNVAIMVAGENKKEVIAQVLGEMGSAYPVQRVQPDGNLDWYIDKAAAPCL